MSGLKTQHGATEEIGKLPAWGWQLRGMSRPRRRGSPFVWDRPLSPYRTRFPGEAGRAPLSPCRGFLYLFGLSAHRRGPGLFAVDQPKQQRQKQTDDDAGRDGEVEGDVFCPCRRYRRAGVRSRGSSRANIIIRPMAATTRPTISKILPIAEKSFIPPPLCFPPRKKGLSCSKSGERWRSSTSWI